MINSQVPIARKDGLVVQELPDEVLVYDLEANKAICLNQTAASVWKSCDGVNSVADIAKSLNRGDSEKASQSLVWLAIDQLKEKNLIENDISSEFKGQSRREVLKKIGLATAMALPVVAMLSFPNAALGATCSTSVCGTQGSCLSGQVCCPPTGGIGAPVCVPGFGPAACGTLGSGPCP